MIGAVTPLLAIPAISHQFGAPGGRPSRSASRWEQPPQSPWNSAGGYRPQAVAATDRSGSVGSRFLDQVSTRDRDGRCPDHMVHGVVVEATGSRGGCTRCFSHDVGRTFPQLVLLGLGSPARIFWSDAVPRFRLRPAWGRSDYGVGRPVGGLLRLPLVGFLASPVFGVAMVRPRAIDFLRAEGVGNVIRRQAVAVRGRGLSAVYIGLPVALVQAWTPAAVPAFAAAERLMRMGLFVLQSVPNVLQRAVGAATRDARSLLVVSSRFWFSILP